MINRYINTTLLTGLLIWLALPANAQRKATRTQPVKKDYWDVLYLKNGSVIKGMLIDSSSATVKIENRINDTLVYTSAEVERITRMPKPLLVTRQGFYGMGEAGIQFSGDEGAVLRAIGGYRFAYQWQAGVGIGLDDYTVRSVPVFADLRYDFSRKPQTLFAYAGAGAAIPWISDDQHPFTAKPNKTTPGFYAHAGLGYKIRMKFNNSLHISAGYARTSMSAEYPFIVWGMGGPMETYQTYNYSYNRVTILLGYSF
jgi:hypothetical protein